MNTFGLNFRVSVLGESHGVLVGVLIDGCPPGISLQPEDFEKDLQRRRSGARGTTERREEDLPVIQTGIYQGYTTGAPILITTANRNTRSEDYEPLRHIARPGHADFTAQEKFRGFNDPRGGGHFSGRLTFGLVAAGTIARKLIQPAELKARLIQAGGKSDIDQAVQEALENADSIGGLIECQADPLPVGWGEPFFYSLESAISQLAFSIPAVKGIEFGSGFRSAAMRGSEHNDLLLDEKGKTETNSAGGINGGLSNGNPLICRIAVKPTSSIGVQQKTYNFESRKREMLEVQGRHDACIALRVPVVLESVVAIALADMYLTNRTHREKETK